MQKSIERKSNNALLANQPWHAEESGDILWSVPPKKIMQVEFVADELALMAADLDLLRDSNPPVRLTEEQMAELEAEMPGAEFCKTPFLY